jgi:adenylate cyclase
MSVALIEQILANNLDDSTRHERRWAVVMFADLRNFTKMVVNVPAPKAIEILNTFFENMAQIIHHYEGTIFDLIGDELEIGFNVPLNQPDAALRALRVAIDMQCRFNELRPNWFKETGITLGLGIGIDAGDVVVGDIGAQTRKNFTMVGEAVNISHRMVDLAEDGQIVISERMYLSIRDELTTLAMPLEFRQFGTHLLKGLDSERVLYRAQIEADRVM